MNTMEKLRKLIELKVELQKRYYAYPHDSPIAWVYGWCANELEALLPAVERELNAAASGTRYYRGDGVEMFPGTQRFVLERVALERGVRMGLEAARKLITENADIVEIVKDAEEKASK